jgi:hypothetical protein
MTTTILIIHTGRNLSIKSCSPGPLSVAGTTERRCVMFSLATQIIPQMPLKRNITQKEVCDVCHF